MELSAFAEAVLLSTDIDTKLHAPAHFTDDAPGSAIATPKAPGRPAILPMASGHTIPAAPTPTSIEDPTIRGLALHTFANHELQAAELVALALLKFPDAPQGFRRGLAKIITDEQRHFRLYQARAEHWGVGLGDAGVGHFFWDTVAHIDSPADFLAALSLTYEQANLDFAVYWKAAFSAVDDPDTVDVLQTVYEDEITHVRHGLVWFERLAGRCDFETYADKLSFPLSPGRAKGPIFNRQGRELVGFSTDFIDELEIRNVSRGRPPRVFSFDPFIEERLAGRTVPARMAHIQQDLAALQMFLAHSEDVVIARRPSLPTLRSLHQLGFEIPQFAESLTSLGDRELGEARPWGTTDHPQLYDKLWALSQRTAFAQAHPSPMLLPVQGVECHSMAQAEPFLGKAFIAKAPLSASGQHRVLLDKPTAAAWLTRHLSHGPVLIEPWHTRLLDLSVQLDIQDAGPKLLGITRFFTRTAGSYQGALIGPWTRGLTPELARAVHGGAGKGIVQELLEQAGHFIGTQAHAMGHRGPLGIDAMVVQTPEGPRLLPILEVNPRTTMGRIALAITKRASGQGGWFFVSQRQREAAGYPDLTAFTDAVQAAEGLVLTSEPTSANGLVTVLSTAPTWQQAMDAWTALGMTAPPLHR